MAILRRSLIVSGGAILFAAGIGGIVAFRTYDEATKIDRSVKTVVVREYLELLLARRDAARAALYACPDESGLTQIIALRDSIEHEERSNGVTTQVVPARLVESSSNSVIVDLKLNQGSGLRTDRRSQTWKFILVDQDGWRVCSAERLPDPSPTPSASTQPTAG